MCNHLKDEITCLSAIELLPEFIGIYIESAVSTGAEFLFFSFRSKGSHFGAIVIYISAWIWYLDGSADEVNERVRS